jgi:hypothetical protein
MSIEETQFSRGARLRAPSGLWRSACLWAFIAALISGPARLLAASFEVTIDQDTAAVGDNITMTLRFEGGSPKRALELPTIPGLQMTVGGESRSYNFVNGVSSSSISRNVIITPTQPGEYRIPSMKVEIDGQVLTSQPLILKVSKPEAQATDKSGEQLAFFKLNLPKKEVYVGEVFQVEFQCYIREGVANAENILQSFDQFNGCPVKAEGVSIIRTAHAQRRRVRVGNGIYGVSTLVTALTPVKAGPLSISSLDVPLTLQLPAQGQRRRDPFFDPFGMFQNYEERKATISAEPIEATVLLLPKEGAPAGFNGAVGTYTMTVTAGPTNVAAGDPITVRVVLTGRGALDALALPQQSAWTDFKTYPPTTKVETTDPLGLQGSKVFEQVVIPQTADLKELPSVSFAYFDSDQKRYQTLTQPAIALIVRPGGSSAQPSVLTSARAPQEPAPPTQDIVANKQRLGALAQLNAPAAFQPWFWALQGVPLCAFVGSLLWRKRAEMLANNPQLRRQKQVAKIVRDGLVQLQQLANDKKSDDFFATLFHLLQEQLGERLDLPASAITEAVIDERLRPLGVPHATLAPLQELFQSCNLVRYAPIKSSQELAAVIPKFEAILRDLQNLNPGGKR